MSNYDLVLHALEAAENLEHGEICARTGLTKREVSPTLTALARNGLAVNVQRGGRGRPGVWAAAPPQ